MKANILAAQVKADASLPSQRPAPTHWDGSTLRSQLHMASQIEITAVCTVCFHM